MKSFVIAFAFLLLAGQARAQYEECLQPSNVPEAVFDTILDQSSFDFGAVTEAVCESIVNKAVATCKAQVKAQAKCFKRASALNAAIAVKQCKQLEVAGEREACVANFKSVQDEINDNVEADKLEGISICETALASELGLSCVLGLP